MSLLISLLQIEGAAYEDGKGPSIWDILVRQHPGSLVIHIRTYNLK